MNQRPQGLLVSKAQTGFLQYKSAEGLASVTVDGYRRDLKLWMEYQVTVPELVKNRQGHGNASPLGK